jgi:hypothetical protein
MSAPDPSVTVVRIELPTPDIVVVRDGAGRVVIFADVRVPDREVEAAIDDLGAICAGPAYPLSAGGR